jgi:ribonuclease P protein component
MITHHTFGKNERLSLKNHLDVLFGVGQAFNSHPLRVVFKSYPVEDDGLLIKIMVSVPKRRFKKAVIRNRIKRLIRESYRLNKELLYEKIFKSSICLHIAIIYIGDKDDISYYEIETALKTCFDKLGKLLTA